MPTLYFGPLSDVLLVLNVFLQFYISFYSSDIGIFIILSSSSLMFSHISLNFYLNNLIKFLNFNFASQLESSFVFFFRHSISSLLLVYLHIVFLAFVFVFAFISFVEFLKHFKNSSFKVIF